MTDELSIRVEQSFTEISPERWSQLSGASKTDKTIAYNPFISHAFLSSLEESGSATAGTGWMGHHLLLETDKGALVGALPGYLKSHSQGEYVFDHGWADAYERAGGSYYPKLQVSVPFTPATGRRLLARPGAQADDTRLLLAEGLAEVCRRSDASSVHVTFPTEAECQLLGEHGYLKRPHRQFHWENAGYRTFDDFLGSLASRKRKVIRRERADALANG